MTFAYEEILGAIDGSKVPSAERDIGLAALVESERLGVGRAGDGSYVFVGAGQATGTALAGRGFRFEPWLDLVDQRSKVTLHDVCILRFWPLQQDDDVTNAVAAVFAGLIDLARAAPDKLSSAIAAMRALFESGLKSRVSRETEIGLAGELLVIAGAVDRSHLVRTWHSDPDGLFDFSAQGERLEVKTTTSPDRVHWFSSTQVSPIPGVCTTFASVMLPLVEVGSTVAETFAGLGGLTSAETARVRSIIIDTTGEPPEVLTSVVFDAVAANASVRHIVASSVPAPIATPGVGRMRWEGTVSDSAGSPGSACTFAAALRY